MKLPLKQIIAEFISSADLSEHQFMRLWNVAVRGAREFQMDITGGFKSTILDVKGNKTADLPTDFLSLSKIGVLNELGEVITLRQNDKLNLQHQQYVDGLGIEPEVATVPSIINYSSPTRFPFLWLNFTSSGTDYHLYGLGSGTSAIGEYKVDEDEKTIYLSADWPYSTILVEYLSDGYDDSQEDYMVDVKAAEAMVAYIRWKNAQDNRKKFTTGDVDYYKKQYYNERRLAKMRINQVDISQMQAVFRSHIKLTAKA